jgi:hypothetical protein
MCWSSLPRRRCREGERAAARITTSSGRRRCRSAARRRREGRSSGRSDGGGGQMAAGPLMAGRGSDMRSEAAGARTVVVVGRQWGLSWMDMCGGSSPSLTSWRGGAGRRRIGASPVSLRHMWQQPRSELSSLSLLIPFFPLHLAPSLCARAQGMLWRWLIR